MPDRNGHDAEHPSQHEHPAFDADWWEEHYRAGASVSTEPSPVLVDELSGLPVGTALEAGCGTGAEAVWLAHQGWEVTAVDVSATAVASAERNGRDQPPEVVDRLTWVVADVARWDPPRRYDLVVSQYVHPDVPFEEFVARLAGAVAPGGTLLLVGHDHADEHSSAHAPADAAIGPAAVTDTLDPDDWEVQVADVRDREVQRGASRLNLRDVVVRARRFGAAP